MLNLSIRAHLIFKRPLKSKIELAQQISVEILFLTVNLSLFVMAITDSTQDNWTTPSKIYKQSNNHGEYHLYLPVSWLF